MRITPRKEWNAREPKSRPVKVAWGQRKKIVIHYSGASPTQTPRSIQNYHMDAQGWNDIGYNYLINSTTGEIYDGRGGDVLGAHVAGHNTETIGICVIGLDNKDRQDVSDKARASIAWLCADLDGKAGRKLTRVGHRDLAATACPGDELYAWMKAGMWFRPTEPAPVPEPKRNTDRWEKAVQQLPVVKQGTRGDATGKCQSLLAANGFPPKNSFRANGTPDGIAGAGTTDAIRAFQYARGLTADGIAGERTWPELLVKGAGR